MLFQWTGILFLISQAVASPLQTADINSAAFAVLAKRTVKEDKITPSDSVVGAPQRGSPFDDKSLISRDHKRLQWVELSGCGEDEHLTWMHVGYGHAAKVDTFAYHGKKENRDASVNYINLEDDRIIKVELVTYKKKVHFTYRTRVGHITLHTKNGHSLSCGGKNADGKCNKVITWYTYGKSLLYFSGTQGDQIDSLQGHFIPSEDY